MTILHAIIQVFIFVLMVLYDYGNLKAITHDPDDTLGLVVIHFLAVAFIVTLFFAHKSIINFIFGRIFRIVIRACIPLSLLVIEGQLIFNGWIYAILTVVCAAAALLAIALISVVNLFKAKKTPLTHRQKNKYKIVCRKDELEKEENA